MKKLKASFVIYTFAIALAFNCIGCGGSSSSIRGDEQNDSPTGASWSESGDDLTIDNIVNVDSSEPSLNKAVSSSASFYFGRFIYDDGLDLHCGSIKFKLNKQDDSSAYFSEVSLENMSTVLTGISITRTVNSSTDLEVDPNYNADSNHIEITDATERFVNFDLDFGNNDLFGDIIDGGLMFTSDFNTMGGGNNASFFFIAQKIDSQPDVEDSDIVDDWSALRFSVDSFSGEVDVESNVEISVQDPNADDLNPFDGIDSEFGDFEGLTAVTDNKAGCFAYTFGSTIDGGFILSADKNLALGYDLTTETYFAMEK